MGQVAPGSTDYAAAGLEDGWGIQMFSQRGAGIPTPLLTVDCLSGNSALLGLFLPLSKYSRIRSLGLQIPRASNRRFRRWSRSGVFAFVRLFLAFSVRRTQPGPQERSGPEGCDTWDTNRCHRTGWGSGQGAPGPIRGGGRRIGHTIPLGDRVGRVFGPWHAFVKIICKVIFTKSWLFKTIFQDLKGGPFPRDKIRTTDMICEENKTSNLTTRPE